MSTSIISLQQFDEAAEAFGAAPTDARISEILGIMFDERVAKSGDPLEIMQTLNARAVDMQGEAYGDCLDPFAKLAANGGTGEDARKLFHQIARYGEWRMMSLLIGAMTMTFARNIKTEGNA